MRTILVVITYILLIIVTLPIYAVLLLVKLFNKPACAKASQAVVRVMFKVLMFTVGAKITVNGVENVPLDTPVLYAGNHRSYADIALAYMTAPNMVGFMAKKQIKKVPGLNWWMANMNCLYLDREDVRKDLKTILVAIDKIKEGYSIFVMPEGTRNHGEELLPFRDGCFKIAEKSGCPIVPVAVTRTDELYELHRPFIRSAKVTIRYGKPISTADMSREDKKMLSSKVRESLEELIEEDKKLFA